MSYTKSLEQFLGSLDYGLMFQVQRDYQMLVVASHGCVETFGRVETLSIPVERSISFQDRFGKAQERSTVEVWVDTTNPQMVQTAMRGVAGCGVVQAVETLLPHWETEEDVLEVAADCDRLEVVALLVPRCNAQHNNSAALRAAVLNNNQTMFDLLLPVSDPQIALKHLRKENYDHPDNPLCAVLAAFVDKKRLEQAIGVHTRTGVGKAPSVRKL